MNIKICLPKPKDQKGMALVMVLALVALMVVAIASVVIMIQQDVGLISAVKLHEQARYMAEAGINQGLASIKEDGLAAWSDISDSLDTGSYSVTLTETGGRYLLASEGTVPGVSKTVSVEVEDKTPTALNYFSGAGNNILLKIHTNVGGTIVGDLHANNNVNLYVQSHATLDITGDVSATGTVTEGSKYHEGDNKDKDLSINGDNYDTATVYEGADRITFPVFDYPAYQALAEDGGDYYSSGQTFSNTTLSPSSGVVYVDGPVTIQGTVTLNGGLIADSIDIVKDASLEQVKTGDRNIIVAKDGNVSVRGRLEAEEAIVYAAQDIESPSNWGAEVTVNGIMLAMRDITMWNFRTDINYTHVYILPPDMTDESSGLHIVSWNE